MCGPDVGSRLIAHMGFGNNLQRASIVGLGFAGALPTMQRAVDFVRANPGRRALMLAVEICSACYFVDSTLGTVVGNAICADGAAAFLLAAGQQASHIYLQIIGFETFHRYRADRGGWTSTSRRKAANRVGSFGSTPRWPHDRGGTPAIAPATWTFEISHWFLGCSSGWTQGDRQRSKALRHDGCPSCAFPEPYCAITEIFPPQQSCLFWRKSCVAEIRSRETGE
jgi:Chalcone and stilbene synthases, N-terminal domain